MCDDSDEEYVRLWRCVAVDIARECGVLYYRWSFYPKNDEILVDDRPAVGFCNVLTREIHIALGPRRSKEQIFETVLHEISHALDIRLCRPYDDWPTNCHDEDFLLILIRLREKFTSRLDNLMEAYS